MKHLEVSQKIHLEKNVDTAQLKKALLERLENTIEIESLGEEESKFNITGTTGTPASITRHASINLDISIVQEKNTAKILISGFARMARSLALFYAFFIFLFLLVGLLPGAISSGPESGPLDVLVFLVLGIFIILDTNKKLAEPKEFLREALESMDTEFG